MKQVIILFFLLSFATLVYAQTEVDYPQRKLIEARKFDKALESLEKVLSKDPDDCLANFSMSQLYSSSWNDNQNLSKAYTYLSRSESSFEKLDFKQSEKVAKHGINLKVYDQYFKTIGTAAYTEACNKNTEESYQLFLDKYLRADQGQRELAEKARNKFAYEKAKAENTFESYSDFINKFPKADEAKDALQQIYRIQYIVAKNTDTEAGYRYYITNYPGSPYVEEVKDLIARYDLVRSTNSDDWHSYVNYINTKSPGKNTLAKAQKSILNIAKSKKIVAAAQYCAENCSGELYDESVKLLHDLMTESGYYKFRNFWDTYEFAKLPELKRKDLTILEISDQEGLNDEFIREAAPYRIAYMALISNISSDLEKRDFESAFNYVKQFKNEFGDDSDYNQLYKILSSPVDKSITPFSLGDAINTRDGGEYAPCISADGKSLLFCGNGRTDNLGEEDIFVSQWKNGKWEKAILFPDINTVNQNEAPEAMSIDNTQLLMFKNGKLYNSKKTVNGWSNPEPFSDNINFSEWQADPTISSDGRVMIYAAKSPMDREFDASVNIFVSLLDENGEWGKPFEIGPTINTPFDDRSPVLHPDMKTLYFCSNGHATLGKMDVFMTKRLNDTSWTEWSEPINLGKEINTPNSDCFYKISTDGKSAYFSQYTQDSEYDLYQVTIPEKLRPQPVATISGKLLDGDSNPVYAKINWEDLETHTTIGQSQTDPTDGSFFIVLPEGKNYGYFINDDKYFPSSDNIDLRNKNELIHIENNFKINTIEKMIRDEIPVTLKNLFFNTAEYDLLPESITELQRVAKILIKLGLKVEISGHTDNVGDDESNRILSENRANSVKNFLVTQGCNEQLLITKGYGESSPVATNSTPQGRQLNRRVELKFIK